ncbi:MAG TPA: DEAD/DEAH box helicase family protein [Phycisphaerae bacterium]|nr:DEAD/DEAH box helicase family protein [Phycisphaerae bacterium]HNU46255.1 DEAD/DEAH box helicase family protein [Phycisphaerae bacterium]
MLELRDYQERSLEVLEEYLSAAGEHGAQRAFVLTTNRPYVPAPSLPGLPYVCLRAPTGGGKTLMAAHAVGIAARAYLHSDQAVCLWLVPSNTIREQTLKALRDREHPYRQVLDARFAGNVRVMDLAEALYVQRATLDGDTTVIVSTLQALRRDDTEGLKVYEPAGALQHHFTGLPPELEGQLEKRQDGSIPYSLCNVLRLRRPLVVVDEAHNARTPLSFDTLARFSPSCIIEFTATPQTEHRPERELFASNVLHHVSAAELKAADMIKLPIRLRTHGEWKEVVASALATRRELEAAAEDEERGSGEYIRPLVLFQAQARSQTRQTLTVEVVRQCLIDDFKVPEDEIAVATGQTRELDDVDLFDRHCRLRYIITVQALKEGWDCSFAYVLCSVADIHSSRAVEQLLGRVLRMPRAKRKKRAELNYAYAFAASPAFLEAAESIRDTLVENLGFQRMEAADFVQRSDGGGRTGVGIAATIPSVVVTPWLNADALPSPTQAVVQYLPATGELRAHRPLSDSDRLTLRSWCSTEADREAVDELFELSRLPLPPVQRTGGEDHPFRVPLLGIRVGEQLELFEADHFLDTEWNLAECDAGLSEAEFPSQRAAGAGGEIDVSEAGQVEMTQFVAKVQEQLILLAVEPGWSVQSLANWLDRQIAHPDIPQGMSSLFMHNLISSLVQTRGLSVEQLARDKFRLRKAVQAKVAEHRRNHAGQAYQALLFGGSGALLEVSAELCLSYAQDRYSPGWYYEGGFQFQKHYFRTIGELRSEGEEFECAAFIDALPQVKYWVRNLERRADSSFWLQTSTDKFYPDFVAELTDGRILVVEYKGADRWSNDDSQEKRAVGQLWAERSGGHCLFVMPSGPNWSAITAAIGA